MLGLRSGKEADKGKVAGTTAEVFTKLYEENFTRVFRYVSYQVNDNDIAEDITSVVFEKALTKFQSYNADKAAFSTWILSIARNTVIDHFRESRKEQTMQIENIRETGRQSNVSPDDVLVRAEEVELLKSCLGKLSQQEQEIISLKFGGEMTNRQIAGSLGLSESNVAVIIYRTIRKLRDQFHRVTK